MAYDVNSGDCLEVSISSRLFGQRLLSVFHYQLTIVGGPLDGPTVINTFDGIVNVVGGASLLQTYVDAISVDVTVEAIVYQWIYNNRRARVVKTPALTAGTVVGTTSPPNIAAAVTKRSEVAGRHGVGTLHMPGLVNGSIDGGNLTIAGMDLYGALQTNLATPINVGGGGNMYPVIWNRLNPANPVKVTTSEVKNTVRTMHRRTVGVGE